MKSLLLANFNTCAISAFKACGTGTANTTANTITYPISGTVTNIGGGAVSDLTLTDTFNSASQAFDSGSLSCSCPSGSTTCSFSTAGSTDCSLVTLSSGGIVNWLATITTSANGGPDFVTATMSGGVGSATSAISNTATCQPQSLSDSIGITKSCDVRLVVQGSDLVVKVGAKGMVTNSSSSSLTLSGTVYDCIGGSFGTGSGTCPTVDPNSCTTNGGTLKTITTFTSLAAGSSDPYTDSYFPSSLPSDECSPTGTTCSCPNGTFNDAVLVVASCTSQFCACPTVTNTATTSCPLCPLFSGTP